MTIMSIIEDTTKDAAIMKARGARNTEAIKIPQSMCESTADFEVMKTNLFEDTIWTESFGGYGTMARGMVLGSAEELAIINGNWLYEEPRSVFPEEERDAIGEADAGLKE